MKDKIGHEFSQHLRLREQLKDLLNSHETLKEDVENVVVVILSNIKSDRPRDLTRI